jgi:hypothetical protein
MFGVVQPPAREHSAMSLAYPAAPVVEAAGLRTGRVVASLVVPARSSPRLSRSQRLSSSHEARDYSDIKATMVGMGYAMLDAAVARGAQAALEAAVESVTVAPRRHVFYSY